MIFVCVLVCQYQEGNKNVSTAQCERLNRWKEALLVRRTFSMDYGQAWAENIED